MNVSCFLDFNLGFPCSRDSAAEDPCDKCGQPHSASWTRHVLFPRDASSDTTTLEHLRCQTKAKLDPMTGWYMTNTWEGTWLLISQSGSLLAGPRKHSSRTGKRRKPHVPCHLERRGSDLCPRGFEHRRKPSRPHFSIQARPYLLTGFSLPGRGLLNKAKHNKTS